MLSVKKRLFLLLFYFVSFSLGGFVFCTHKYFGNVTFDQILFVFALDALGALKADGKMIAQYTIWCALLPIAAASVIVFFDRVVSLVSRKVFFYHRYVVHLLLISCMIVFVFSFYLFFNEFNLKKLWKMQFSSDGEDYIKQQYVSLSRIKMASNKTRENLLLIYVESLEATYQNSDVFGENLLRALSPWQKRGITFEKSYQLPGTGWTLAGIISTQCGLPLKFYHNRQTERLVTVLPKAVCLTDVLSEAGYHNVFMKGASLRFSGLNQFLKSHHVHEAYGKEEWLQKGYSLKQMSGWGLYDDDLFREAKITLSRLFATKKPFALTLLTVDLHGPTGIIGTACRDAGVRDYRGLVSCQANMLATFLHDVEKAGWLRKMNVVVIGDHLVMRNPLSDQLNAAPERSIFNLMLPIHPMKKTATVMTHFSWLPTLLTLLNFEIPGARAGLGISAISKEGAFPIAEFSARDLNDMQEKLLNPSRTYQSFWL